MFQKENQCTLTSTEIQMKAESFLKQMTLKEKFWLLNGNWEKFSRGRLKENLQAIP